MKQTDITPCVSCGLGVANGNVIAFFRVKVEHFVLNVGAIQRQSGLEQMLGGNAALAFHMGPQEDIAMCATEVTGLVCQHCLMKLSAAAMWESLGKHSDEEAV